MLAVHMASEVEAKVFDVATVIHLLSGNYAKNFYEYGQNSFISYSAEYVWDTYRPDSQKSATLQERGS